MKPQQQKRQITQLITNVQQRNNKQEMAQQMMNDLCGTFTIVRAIIEDIVQRSEVILEQHRVVKCYLNEYSEEMERKVRHQIIQMQTNKKKDLEKLQQQDQPNPLISDNLIPVGTALQYKSTQALAKQNTQQPKGFKQIVRNSSYGSIKQKSYKSSVGASDTPSKKSNLKVYNIVKLKQSAQQVVVNNNQDQFVDELRKRKLEQMSLKVTDQTKKKNNLRDIIKKDQKISYDFSGDIIKVKNNNKANFLTRSVEGNENQLLIKQKQAKTDIEPTQLNLGIKKDFLSKNNNRSKRGPQVQFSQIASLTPQMKVNEGVKFLHNKAVLEKKVKQAGINQLKKDILNRKLSRKDFSRLQSLGSNRSIKSKNESPSLPTIIGSQIGQSQNLNQTELLQRAHSQSKFENSQTMQYTENLQTSKKRQNKTQRRPQQKINIQNEQLVEILLEKTYNSVEQLHKLRLPIQDNKSQLLSKIQKLNTIDRGNLNFLKTGSVGKLQFPKITYRTKETKNKVSTLLSSHESHKRSKLKGINKDNHFQNAQSHFQEKLRI